MNVGSGALPENTRGILHFCSPSDASSFAATTAESSTCVSLVEAPLLSERRRSSSISFEKHDLFILRRLAEDLSESDTDDDDDTSIADDHEDDGILQVRLRYNSDDNESVSHVMEEGTEEVAGPGGREEDALLNREIRGNFRSSFRRLDRRTSDLSVDLNELSEALPLEEEEEEEEHLIEQDNHCCSNSRVSRSSVRSSSSILGMIQEEIISDAIAAGKLVEKPMPPVCNTLGRRSSHSSWSSGKRVSFASSSNIFRENIESALEELQAIDGDDDGDDAKDPGEGSGIATNADHSVSMNGIPNH